MENKEPPKPGGGRSAGKKVGFASNLATPFEQTNNTAQQQNQSPASGSDRPWDDSETGHLLTYFLDESIGSGIPDFSNTETTAPNNPQQQNETIIPPAASPASAPGSASGVSGGEGSWAVGSTDGEQPEPMAPPTPKAPQYYPRAAASDVTSGGTSGAGQPNDGGATRMNPYSVDPRHQHYSQMPQPPGPHSAVPSSASSSSSSLSTMANNGPMLLHHMQQQLHQESHGRALAQQQQQQMYASMMAAAAAQQSQWQSPVSPAAMIGTPENLMLPPPNGHPPVMGQAYQSAAAEAAAAANHSMQPPPPQPPHAPQPHPASSPISQQQHLAWLRDINAMAKAGNVDATQQQPPPPQQTPAQPPPQAQPPPPPPHGLPPGVPVHPAAQLGIPFTAFPHMTFYGHAAVAAAAAMQQSKNPAPEESEEKRAKRLERNRESARKSRRRKKERLATVEAQATKMHQKIAAEREQQIEKLVPGLRKLRGINVTKFQEIENATNRRTDPAAVMTVVRETGPNSPIFQAVLEFQFNSLQSFVLPRYQKLWLWLSLNDEHYFTDGKEQLIKRDPDRMVARTSSGKLSSKQVGDELVNGPPSLDNKRPAGPSKQPDDAARTSRADDTARMWPLMCYEHQFSVDQEERFLNLHKKLRHGSNGETCWKQSKAAIKGASLVRDAMDVVCKAASNREERTLVGVLRVDQISKYRQWMVMNHDRCTRSLRSRQIPQEPSAGTGTSAATSISAETQNESLEDISLRLERVLRISKR